MSQNSTLILGAGPAGLACAMELYRANQAFTVVEKDTGVGGLSRTYQFGAFRTDNGPHRFFSQNQYLYDFIEDLIGEQWIKVNRYTRFYIHGKFYKYPVEWKDALTNMGLGKAFRAFFDYLIERIRRRKIQNFEEFAISNFGRTLAEFNVLNYTEKIWGLSCNQLSVDWAQQRIKGLSLRSLMTNALFRGNQPRSLVDQFYYPDMGTGLIYESIRKKIEPKNTVLLENEPKQILHNDNRITSITLKSGQTFSPEHVVSSIPITVFTRLLNPAPPKEVLHALECLRYRSQVYLFLTLNKPSVTRDQWIYFPDREIPFGRISEMKNFSKKMAPQDKTSLFIEFFCWKDDETWNMSREDLFETAIPWLEKLNLVQRDEVQEIHHIKKANVYPVYDLKYRTCLNTVTTYLDQFSNLIYIGRPGRFKYTNQDHSLEMGILAARSIVDGKPYNIENVGTERASFERGYLKHAPSA